MLRYDKENNCLTTADGKGGVTNIVVTNGELNFSGKSRWKAEIEAIALYIEANPATIQHVKLDNAGLSDALAQRLLTALSKAPHLTVLSLSSNHLTSASTNAIFGFLVAQQTGKAKQTDNPQQTDYPNELFFNLNQNKLDNKFAYQLSRVIVDERLQKREVKIRLDENNITANGVSRMCRATCKQTKDKIVVVTVFPPVSAWSRLAGLLIGILNVPLIMPMVVMGKCIISGAGLHHQADGISNWAARLLAKAFLGIVGMALGAIAGAIITTVAVMLSIMLVIPTMDFMYEGYQHGYKDALFSVADRFNKYYDRFTLSDSPLDALPATLPAAVSASDIELAIVGDAKRTAPEVSNGAEQAQQWRADRDVSKSSDGSAVVAAKTGTFSVASTCASQQASGQIASDLSVQISFS